MRSLPTASGKLGNAKGMKAMQINNDVRYVGVNDHEIDLFEGQYAVPNGMSYNSYLVLDELVAVMDTVDVRFSDEWLRNVDAALQGRVPDYLVVQHVEPDHSASVVEFASRYPTAKIVASAKAFVMLKNFFRTDFSDRRIVVAEGDTLPLGKHVLQFIAAPMVHWPEVVVTYDRTDKILFSADGFGKFGANDREEPWLDEARRYYIGIVGKYGVQVQKLLQKAAALEIETICPLHGPVLSGDLSAYLHAYDVWSSYRVEEDGVVVAYTSVYGNTRGAALRLAEALRARGRKVTTYDLARCDMAAAVADAFRYGDLVLATTTYNGDIFPYMRTFIEHLVERSFQNRCVALIENGSWAPVAARVMHSLLEECKGLTFADTTVKLLSACNADTTAQLDALANELCTAVEKTNAPKKAYTCKVCGYVYEGETLPPDFTCPVCRQGAGAFEEA